MDLSEVQLGKIYKCKLSKKEMLVLELDKPTGQEDSGKKDANDNPIMVETFEKVKAGKYVDEVNGIPTFKVDELSDGQLEEITD